MRPLLWPDGKPRLWIDHTHRELGGHTEELQWIYIIAGATQRARTAVEELTRRANAAGATSTIFGSLDEMIRAMQERTYWRMVLMPDISLLPKRGELTRISKARGAKDPSIPIIIARDTSWEWLPENTHRIASTWEAIRDFHRTILELLKKKN